MSDSLCQIARSQLDKFERIGLENMPPEVLMDRIDRKFPFHVSRIAEVINHIEDDYFILEAAGDVVSPYDTLYLDTDELRFYHNHHRGKRNRLKIRYRGYPKTGTYFLEVKRKDNRSRTSKERIPVSKPQFPLTSEAQGFLNAHVGESVTVELSPTISIHYNRLAFIDKDFEERFSIDFDIRFQTSEAEGSFEDLAVAEIKQERYRTTPIVRHFRDLGLRESSMSKYCLALATLRTDLKSGAFKQGMRKLKKITHAA